MPQVANIDDYPIDWGTPLIDSQEIQLSEIPEDVSKM